MADQKPEVTEAPDGGFNVAYPDYNVGVHADQASTPEEALKVAEPIYAEFVESEKQRKAGGQ